MTEKDPKPLDISKLKEAVRHESAKMYLRSFSTSGKGESAFTLALALCAAVKKIYYEKSGTTFSGEPKLVKKPIIQFIRRMRVDAMEKFNSTTAFSVVQFAPNEEGLEKQAYMVTPLVVYLEQKFLPEFLRLLQYPYIDSDDEMEVKDGCGTIANIVGGQYKREMAVLGYKDMMMSAFESYINTAADGVGIPDGPTEKYEISFEVEGTKRLVVEMITLSMLPKWEGQEKTKPKAKKILIIDDDPTQIKTIESFLQAKDYEVISARDGHQGLERLKENPDLIVLDLQMPNMDGYDFILALKEIMGVRHAPIMVMTSREGLNEIMNVEGVKEYMIKPINPSALLKSIERYV